MLTFEQIKELIELVAQRRLQGLEIERSGFRLKVDGQPAGAGGVRGSPAAQAGRLPPPAAAGARRPRPRLRRTGARGGRIGGGQRRTSSTRRSSAPSTALRLPTPIRSSRSGSRVKKGQVLCIIEAMKLMNEIESDVDGEVVEIYPQNAQPVEYGEPLFAIRSDSAPRSRGCSRRS